MPLETQTMIDPQFLNRFVTDWVVSKIHGGRQHVEVEHRRPRGRIKNSCKWDADHMSPWSPCRYMGNVVNGTPRHRAQCRGRWVGPMAGPRQI
jgi:hypothetical protein